MLNRFSLFQKICSECNLSLCVCDAVDKHSKTILLNGIQNDSSFNLLLTDNPSSSPQPHCGSDSDDTQSNLFLVNDFSNSIMSLNTNTRINNSQSLDYHTVHALSDIIAIVPTDTSMRPDASNNFLIMSMIKKNVRKSLRFHIF